MIRLLLVIFGITLALLIVLAVTTVVSGLLLARWAVR
jgi:hypothetical protein